MVSGPVMSTDKLEKPKRNNNQQSISQTSSNLTNPPSAPCTGSLPRRNASGVFYRTPQDFVGGSQQSNLRRNCSMNDLQQKNREEQSSWLPAPPPQVKKIFDNNDSVSCRLKRASRFPPVWFEALSSLFFKDRFSLTSTSAGFYFLRSHSPFSNTSRLGRDKSYGGDAGPSYRGILCQESAWGKIYAYISVQLGTYFLWIKMLVCSVQFL